MAYKPPTNSLDAHSAKVLEAFDVVIFALLRPRRWKPCHAMPIIQPMLEKRWIGTQGEPGGVQENPGGAARFRFAFIARSGYLCLLPAVGGAEEMGDDYFPQYERHFEKFLNYPKLRL